MSDDDGNPTYNLRHPSLEDGAAVAQLVRDVGTLEPNTVYAYLLLAHHFGDSCILAERGGKPVGCILGYRLPKDPSVYFLWQVGVAASERGQGLAKKMLHELARRLSGRGVNAIEMTVAPSNQASNRLFDSFAKQWGAPIERSTGFEARHFGPVGHEEELLVRIAPLRVEAPARVAPPGN